MLSARPVGAKLKSEGFIDAFVNTFKLSESTFANLGANITNLFEKFINIIQTNWQSLGFSIVMFVFVLTFFNYFVNALADIPVCDILYGKMSCDAKFGFCGCFIRNLKTSVVYSTVKMFSVFIADVVVFSAIFGVFKLCSLSAISSWLAPFMAVSMFIILFAFRKVLFACVTPLMVINGYNVFKSLAKSFKLAFKNFFDCYGTAIALIICLLGLILFLGIFTCGTGLIVIIPASSVIMYIFNMVVFYSNNGMYFYIGTNNIQDQSKGVKKLEQLDTVKDLKNLI